ncbi:MAG: hypothetical protein VCF24_13380, partial [Candidatus Latescibacterota bacterium]
RLVRGDMEGRVDVVAVISGVTPLQVEHIETRLERGSRCYYRLLVRSRADFEPDLCTRSRVDGCW